MRIARNGEILMQNRSYIPFSVSTLCPFIFSFGFVFLSLMTFF